jgi:hypothetical protein
VTLIGVWSWRGTNEAGGKVALPDWERIPLNGRFVYILFDSDVMLNRKVYAAQKRLQAFLESRGALVILIYLPPAEGGAKQGVDDFFASDRSIEELALYQTDELRSPPHEATELASVHDHLEEAPVPEGLLVPAGYAIGPGGILSLGEDGEPRQIATSPAMIRRLLKDLRDGRESVELCWPRHGQWVDHVVGREQIAATRELTTLAAYGFPANADNAHDMVRYLSAFEATNDLPVDSVSGHLGWAGDGFLLGREYLGDGTPAAFKGADDGDERLADALSCAGDFEAWREVVKSILCYPRAAVGLYASLAAPVLKVLGAPSFVVDFSGSTSTGKTTVLRLAASAWGNPEPGSGILGTWNSTRVYIERASAVLHDLPLILDDTKGVKYPNLVAQTIYDYTTGQGRGRGSKAGLGAFSSWRGVLISSGEQKATSFTQDAGQHARVLALWGSPFGGPNAEVVNALVHTIRSNYGHAGPHFVRFLLEHRDEWLDYRKEYDDARWRYAQKAAGNPVAARLADNLAALNITAALAFRALGLPYSDPIEPLYEDLMREAAEADKPKEALIAALSWAASRPSTLYGRHRESPEGKATERYGGWNGRWDAHQGYEFIAFSPVNLKNFLSSEGFHPESILRSWKDRGWLDTDGDDSRLTKKIRLGSTSTRMIYVKRSAVSEVGMG